MTSEELGSIRAHLAAVSPYPWRGDSDDGARMRRAVLDANGDLVVFGSDHDGDPYYGIHEAPGQEYAPNEALIIQAPVYVAALLDEVARLTSEVERLSASLEAERTKRRAADAVLSAVAGWVYVGGAAFKPTPGAADSFGDGMRAAKNQIADILRRHLNPTPWSVP